MRYREKRKKIRIAAATMIAIFNLGVVFVGAYAWFVSARTHVTDSVTYGLENISGNFLRLTIHELDTSKSTSSVYKFYKTASGTITPNWSTHTSSYVGSNIDFGRYTLTSPNHPLLFLYVFNEELTASSEKPVSISGKTNSTFLADGETNQQGAIIKKIAATHNPLSSIIQFKSFSYASNNTGITGISSFDTTDQTYNYALSSLNGSNHFVNLTLSGNELVYSGFDNETDFFNATTGNIKYVAIVFDYYQDALEYIYNFYLGDEVLDNETLSFDCDWTTLVV